MALLHNEVKTLRLDLQLVDREAPPAAPAGPPAARVLGTVAVEFFDRRDQSFWPFLRLPVLHLEAEDGEALVRSLRELCSLQRSGFAFRAGALGELALQVGRQEGGGFIVEVGLDLAPFVLETSGLQGEPGRELALFRFGTSTAELVRFADQVKQELENLPPPRAR